MLVQYDDGSGLRMTINLNTAAQLEGKVWQQSAVERKGAVTVTF